MNDIEDVYQREQDGHGFCGEEGGCVYLVSDGKDTAESGKTAGTATGESAFIDASESGDDVFFGTNVNLVLQDTDTDRDYYDARICSASEPCLTSGLAAAACDEEACRQPATPPPPIFGPPASDTFSGPGNLTPIPTPPVKPKLKPLTRAQRLAKALRACKGKRKKPKRRSCERAARKKYGPKVKAKKSETNRQVS